MAKMDSPKKSSLKRSILKKASPLRAVHPDIIVETEEEPTDASQSELPLAAKEVPNDAAGSPPKSPNESKADKVTLRPKLERNLKDSFRVSSDRLSSSSKSRFLKRRKRPDSVSPHMTKIKESETSFPFPEPGKGSLTDKSEPKSPNTHTILKVKAEIHEERPSSTNEDQDPGYVGSIKGDNPGGSSEVFVGGDISDVVSEPSSDNHGAELVGGCQTVPMVIIEDGLSSPSPDNRPDLEEHCIDDPYSEKATERPTEDPCGTLSSPMSDEPRTSENNPLNIPIIIIIDEGDDMSHVDDTQRKPCERTDDVIRISVDDVEVISDNDKVSTTEDLTFTLEEEQSRREAKEDKQLFIDNQQQDDKSQIRSDVHVSGEVLAEHRSQVVQGDSGYNVEGNIGDRQSTDDYCVSDGDLSEDDTMPIKVVPNDYIPPANNQMLPCEDSLMDYDEDESLV